jgi:hypothetical protein
MADIPATMTAIDPAETGGPEGVSRSNAGCRNRVRVRCLSRLGGQNRAKLGGNDMLLRVQVTNVIDKYGWLVSNSGVFTYTPGRTFIAQLSADT